MLPPDRNRPKHVSYQWRATRQIAFSLDEYFFGDNLLKVIVRHGGNVGMATRLWCVREFYVAGKETLAPWSPPGCLVETAPYRHSRNPMYAAVTLALLGWAFAFGSWSLLACALVIAAAFHLRVVPGEELWLSRSHGCRREQYKKRVPRWLW